MRIDTSPNFYLVVPGIHTNAKDIPIYKVVDAKTKEVVKQIPSEEDIVLIEHMHEVKNRLFPKKW